MNNIEFCSEKFRKIHWKTFAIGPIFLKNAGSGTARKVFVFGVNSGPYIPAFGLNTDSITPNMEIFYAVRST